MNLEHCFTASMTAHSIRILLELKMTSFGLSAGAKKRFPSTAPLLKAMLNVQQFLNVLNSWLVNMLLDKAVNK